MSSPQLCLRWNNHHPNFISIFKNLLEAEELVDVTLSINGQIIRAHKIILSACSPYFKQMFSSNPCKHPSVILSDMKFDDLKTIIEFMYCGEIIITDERLPDILEAAEALQVRGLWDPSKKESKTQALDSKKKKSVMASRKVLNQSYVPEQSHKVYSNENTPGPSSEPSIMKWVKEGPNENEFNSECTTSAQGSFSTPDLICKGKPNVSFQSDQSGYPPSPRTAYQHSSPTTHSSSTTKGPVKRRNSKVQESENFHLALEAVRTGKLGFCKAARLYGLNNRTLWLEYKKRGYPTKRSQPVALKLKQANSC